MTREEWTTVAVDKKLHSALKEIATYRGHNRHDILLQEALCKLAEEDPEVKRSLERYNINCEIFKEDESHD